MEEKRSEQLQGGLVLLRELMSGKSLTAGEAAALPDFGMKKAAAQRFLKALELLIPQVTSGGKPRRWRFDWPNVSEYDTSHLWALEVALSAIPALRGSWIDTKLKELQRLVISNLSPDDRSRDLSRMFFHLAHFGGSLTSSADVADAVAQGIFERRVVRVRYCHFDGKEDALMLAPYSLVTTADGLYCIAKCQACDRTELVEQVRVYNIDRFDQPVLTDVVFDYPQSDEYNPQELFKYSWGVFLPDPRIVGPADIALVFDESWSSYLKRHQLHSAQYAREELESGRTGVRLKLHITYDLVRWLRGLGRDVEIMSPPELCEWVSSGNGAKGGPRALYSS